MRFSFMDIYRRASFVIVTLFAATRLLHAAEPPAYRVLAADNGRVAIVNSKSEVEWEVKNAAEVHDIVMLKNGNVLFPTDRTTIVEMTPDKKVAWKHVAKPKPGYTGKIEIHAFQ